MTTHKFGFVRDPLIKRFLSGTLFASAFVWMAVTQFDVPTEVVWVFLKLSFIFVGVMILIGLLLMPVMALFRRHDPGMLSSLDDARHVEPGDKHPSDSTPTADDIPGTRRTDSRPSSS